MDTRELLEKYAVQNALEYGEAQKDAVIGKVFADNPELKEDAGAVVATAEEVLDEINTLSAAELEERAEQFEYADQETADTDPLPDLTGAEDGEVVVRFAPNPNGPPTLGSSRGMVINGALAEKYDGRLVLRFDDTDPRTKRPLKTDTVDAYQWYEEDFAWLGYEPDEVVYSSKQFEKYYKHAEELIEEEVAYVCRCSPEEGSTFREAGEACPHRDRAAADNLADWEAMQTGGVEEGEAVLRIKTDMQHKNPAVRDWVAFRIIDDPDHPITGDRYRVWPLLDFAGAIEDHYTGTTHIVRGKDLRASTKRQQYVYDALGWEYPEVRYWGRVSISGFDAPMSTSTLAEQIQQGDLEGWDDPRAPTLRALQRRGFGPEAIRDFWLEMGVTETDAEASMETLATFNRKVIDAEADRYFFVQEPFVPLRIPVDEAMEVTIPNHPEEDHGHRTYTVEPEDGSITVHVQRDDLDADMVRLKDLCNIHDIDPDAGTARIHSTDHMEAVDRGAPVVQWVPEQHSRTCTVRMPDGDTVTGVVEADVPEAVVQFLRFGFVHVEVVEADVEAVYTHS